MPSVCDQDLTDGGGADGALTDLFVIGGGINACGIARDAAGRGLSVRLAEAGDLAQATSSATTKLIHGGLRYLEYLDFRLVRESLAERDVLLKTAPHLLRPLRFVMPYDPQMRFEDDTPVARLISRMMPWLKGRRPAFMLRTGLFLYDHLARHETLPGTTRLDLRQCPEGAALRPGLERGWEYSDVWADDARLTALAARDAAIRGADIMTRAQVREAYAEGGLWYITLLDGRQFRARALINAAGPWAAKVIRDTISLANVPRMRLVRGSHLVTKRLYSHDRAYILQGPDGRIVFVIPYLDDLTMIGTTDVDHDGDPAQVHCTDSERDYLLDLVNRWLRVPVTPDDVIWSFAGVRPLFDDGSANASATSRDYVLRNEDTAAPCISVLGGKMTTHRKLAEAVMAKLLPQLSGAFGTGTRAAGDWTAAAPLPGGDFPWDQLDGLIAAIAQDFPWMTAAQARRMGKAYGTETWTMLKNVPDPGRHFGAGLYEVELDWMLRREFATRAEDALFRRSKLGLYLDAAQRGEVAQWFGEDILDPN